MDFQNEQFFMIKKENNLFLIFRNLEISKSILDKIKEIDIKSNIVNIIFDIDDLSKKITLDQEDNIHKIIKSFDNENEYNYNLNIYFKNCLIIQPSSDEDESNMLYIEGSKLLINKLYISDELYVMSPYLNLLFQSYFPKELILKKIKINSKLQLTNFFNFIIKNEFCEKLILEDISIELIIKNNEKEENYNELNQYFYYSKGKIYIKHLENKKYNIKNIKLIDCPLFAIDDDTFFEINKYKDISIDIDNNSLLNPDIIAKFNIEEGLLNICYDLDSYKYNIEVNKDYFEYVEYIIEIIIKNRNNYRKIKFKNFEMTKLEYIIGENATKLNINNLIFNDEEKLKKLKFEEFDKKIKEKIKDKKLENIKELIFDNCCNFFIELILSMTNSDLNLLKFKKCAKDYLNINNISLFNINHLNLFDTPINYEKEINFHVNNLTININGLEYYCVKCNFNYNKIIEKIIEFISNEKNYDNICFEMNALPEIMSILFFKAYKSNKKILNDYLNGKLRERNNFIQKNNVFYIKGLENKNIKLKKNNIIISLEVEKYNSKNEFSMFNHDEDYLLFFNQNKAKTIIFDDTFINNYPSTKNEFDKSINLFNSKMNIYLIDFKSLNYLILNRYFSSFSLFYKEYNFFNSIPKNAESLKIKESNIYKHIEIILGRIKNFLNSIIEIENEVTFVINNIKERKEFYFLLCIYQLIRENDKLLLKNENLDKHFLKEITKQNKENDDNEESIENEESEIMDENKKIEEDIKKINYYYLSPEEIEIFGEPGKENKKIKFKEFKFKIEYSNKTENIWNIPFY